MRAPVTCCLPGICGRLRLEGSVGDWVLRHLCLAMPGSRLQDKRGVEYKYHRQYSVCPSGLLLGLAWVGQQGLAGGGVEKSSSLPSAEAVPSPIYTVTL